MKLFISFLLPARPHRSRAQRRCYVAGFAVFSFLFVSASAQNPPATPTPPAPAGAVGIANYMTAMVTRPPAELGLDPFYTKYADAFGIPIVASDQTEDAALLVARDIVNYMLAKRPDVRADLTARGSRVMIMAYEEQQTDLPEYRTMRKPAKDDPRLTPRERERYDQPGGIGSRTDQEYWNQRARGMGGVRTSCAEENLLGRPETGRYYGEHICVHEFSHGIMSALRRVDAALMKELEAAYANAKATGLFKGHYAENTIAEYWAEGTQWWFWSNYAWTDTTRNPPDGVRVFSPDELELYDPALFAVLEKVYIGHRIPADIYHGRGLRRAGRGGPASAEASR